MSASRFPILFTGVNTVMPKLGLNPDRAYVEVDDATVHVRMGWMFRATFPRTAVVAVDVEDGPILRRRRAIGWGAHGWRGRWLVNGSMQNIVRIEIEPRQRGWVLGFPLRLRELRVSVVDRPGLVAALGDG